jgi:hypothetical protein
MTLTQTHATEARGTAAASRSAPRLTRIPAAASPLLPVQRGALSVPGQEPFLTTAQAGSGSREDVGRRFESLFLKKLVEELRVSAGGDEGMFGSGPGSGIQEDWFDQIFADHLADTGRFGFAKLLPRENSDA